MCLCFLYLGSNPFLWLHFILIHVHAVFSDPLSAVNSLPFCVHLQTEGRTKEVLHSLGCLLRISIQVLSKCLFWKTLWRAYRWTATKNELCSRSKNTKETCVKQISLCKIELCLQCNYFSWGHFHKTDQSSEFQKHYLFPSHVLVLSTELHNCNHCLVSFV